MSQAESTWGRISAAFGWTNAAKVASGERPTLLGFWEAAAVGSVFGVGLGFVLRDFAATVLSSEALR